MLKIQFARQTTQNYQVDRLADGYIVSFDVYSGENNSLDVVVKEQNENGKDVRFPYTIRFSVKTSVKDGTTVIKPIVSKSFIRDYGRIGQERLTTLFMGRLLYQMGNRSR